MSKLLIETIDKVQLLTLNRPETKNAFDADLWGLLRDALNSASDNPEVHSVIVTGASNTFSSGVDLASMVGDGGANYEEPFETCVDALIHYKKPLIAAVDGTAIGGGATILLHFDAVFISPNAKVKYPFFRSGLSSRSGKLTVVISITWLSKGCPSIIWSRVDKWQGVFLILAWLST